MVGGSVYPRAHYLCDTWKLQNFLLGALETVQVPSWGTRVAVFRLQDGFLAVLTLHKTALGLVETRPSGKTIYPGDPIPPI